MRPRSLRIRSTIMRFSARSFSLVEQLAPQLGVASPGRCRAAGCPSSAWCETIPSRSTCRNCSGDALSRATSPKRT